MRSIILLTAILLVFSASATNKKNKHRYTRHHHKQVENLNMIRRGPVERAAPAQQDGDNVLILGQDGKLRYGSLKDELLNKCKANLQKEYKLCAAIQDCDICSATPYCGWCENGEKGKQCVPGSAQGTDCPGDCLANWKFNKDQCTGKVKSGSLDNVAPEATKLVDAVWANPKVQINTHETLFDDQKEEVLVGKKSETKKITYLDQFGKLHTTENFHESPVYGEVHRNIPIGQKDTKEVIDMTTGQRLDLQELDKKNHGVDKF